MPISCPDFYLKRLWGKIYLNSRIAFISCFIIGLMTHIFMLTNKLPNHDDINQIFDSMHRPESGRWFLFFPASISSTFSLPWLNGLLCILYISLSAAIVVKCLNIKSLFGSVLIGGVMITFPTVCATLSYMNSSDGYFFALLLACIAVYLTDKYSLGFLPGGVLMMLSMGIYQAYFPFAAALAVSILLKTIITTKPQTPPPTIFWVKTSKFLALLTIGILLYMVVTKAIPTELSSYMRIDSMGSIQLSELPLMIIGSYQNIFNFFFVDSMLSDIFAMRYLLAVAMLLGFCLPIFIHKLYLSKFYLAFYLILIISLPLACNLIYIMSSSFTPHVLMVYGFTMIIITIISLSETLTSSSTFALWIVSFLSVVLIFDYAVLSNQAYFKLHMAYEQGFAYSNRLLSRIEGLEGFSDDNHVYFVGVPSVPMDATPEYPTLNKLTGIIDDIPSYYSYAYFLRFYMGSTLDITLTHYYKTDEDAELLSSFELDDMPIYPNDGSIKKTDNNIVIKFSEVEQTN